MLTVDCQLLEATRCLMIRSSGAWRYRPCQCSDGTSTRLALLAADKGTDPYYGMEPMPCTRKSVSNDLILGQQCGAVLVSHDQTLDCPCDGSISSIRMPAGHRSSWQFSWLPRFSWPMGILLIRAALYS
jgi:hypothetical protein